MDELKSFMMSMPNFEKMPILDLVKMTAHAAGHAHAKYPGREFLVTAEREDATLLLKFEPMPTHDEIRAVLDGLKGKAA